MDTLAIPSTSSALPRDQFQSLRSVRSTGSMRTPHSSEHETSGSIGYGYVPRLNPNSLSPPDLSFSKSSILSDQEPEFMARVAGGTFSSQGLSVADSWKSRFSNSKGKGTQSRVRLDSVFGTSLPGFPYINSAAAATTGATSAQLREKASWSGRSTFASGSVQSHSAKDSSATVSTTADADTSCSGASNSSDEVDLDLSWDMDVLRARQRAQQMQRTQRAAQKGKAAHVGIDISPSFDLPIQNDDVARRYRLAGKQRMSRSAIELRPGVLSLPSDQYAHDPALPPQSASHIPMYLTATARTGNSSGALSVQILKEERGDGGWSFATTPPLSPSELVAFAEQQYSTSPGQGSTGSRSSRLFRKRRPSAPLMQLLDKTIRNSPVSASSDTSWHSPPISTHLDVGGVHTNPSTPGLTISPDTSTSNWNSPKSPDENPTPITGEYSHFQSMMMPTGGETGLGSDYYPIQPGNNTDAKEGAEKAHRVNHARRSSSLFHLPLVSLLARSMNPGSATPIRIISEGAPVSRPGSPKDHRSEEGHSQDSHGNHSQGSQHSSPPRLGATSFARIDDSMLRPGPHTGQGRLSGLGLQMPCGRERQSSLPVLSFPSLANSSGQPRESDTEDVLQIREFQGSASAPATTVTFAYRNPILLYRKSRRLAASHVQEQAIDVHELSRKRPRRVLQTSAAGVYVPLMANVCPSEGLGVAALLV
ncbi:MAG: hypothetical protein CYPHOPRED_000992 [Cyphobasidiales sp. Tagirdzhanova-0007]|nr:MAG: hypothetical protein CYPHOPRED_000992 [Cyphobasidiales sp. Tagirdzhanova-0007]